MKKKIKIDLRLKALIALLDEIQFGDQMLDEGYGVVNVMVSPDGIQVRSVGNLCKEQLSGIMERLDCYKGFLVERIKEAERE